MTATIEIYDNGKLVRSLGECEVNNLEEYVNRLCCDLCKPGDNQLDGDGVAIKTICNGKEDVTYLSDVCAG